MILLLFVAGSFFTKNKAYTWQSYFIVDVAWLHRSER